MITFSPMGHSLFSASGNLPRRTFLHRCGVMVVGSLLAVSLTTADQRAWAAGPASPNSRQMTPGDRALLKILSAYGTDSYFWGSQVFARATGLSAANGATNLLVRVDDFPRLVAFLQSRAMKFLGRVTAANNTLSFTYQGATYNVTNQSADDFSRTVAAGGVTRDHLTGVGVFAHQAVLYHPATDTMRDPYLAVGNKHLDLVEKPTGGVRSQMQTLLDGWREARQQDLDFGSSFTSFQKDLLASQPTQKTASQVALTLLDNLSGLAGLYNVDEVSALLDSPLVSASLQSVLGLDVDEAVATAKTLRAEPALASYPDAAIWLAALLPSQIEAGTADEWLASPDADSTALAATRAALLLAKQLVKASASGKL